MIYVIAAITVKPEHKTDFLRLFKANVPAVLAEAGCISYVPTSDCPTGLAMQLSPREQVVTVVEAWASLDHLKGHLDSPHMQRFREMTREMTSGLSLQVVEPV